MQQDNLLTDENEAAPNVPAKFRDAETGKIRLDRLLQSYQELERKLSSNQGAPKIPATPDEYKITLPNESMQMDAEVNRRLHEKGFTEEQVQEVYDLAAEKLMPVMQAMVAEFDYENSISAPVESRMNWIMDVNILPSFYWDSWLRGYDPLP